MKILNRKNELVDYNEEKLFAGIAKASLGTKEEGEVIKNQEKICQAVLDLLLKTVKHPTVVDITNAIPRALIQEGFVETAEKFLVYATKHKSARCNSKIDPVATIDEYINKEDWRVKANANQGYSVGGMILNSSGKMSANYWFDNVYPEDASYAHRNGDIHIHDADCLMGYCAGWSLKTLLNEGLNGIDGKVEAGAPKHLSAAIGQMVNFLGALQNEFAGAQAFSSFDTYLAPFVYKRRKELEKDYEDCVWNNWVKSEDEEFKKDVGKYWERLNTNTNYCNKKLRDRWVEKKLKQEVLQQMQEFIYNLNVPSRWGTQTPFTNVTFDIKCPEQLKDQIPMIGGVPVNELEEFKDDPFTYGDLEKEMTLITQCYFEVMSKGDKNGRIFTFPIPTINIGKKFDWDNPDLDGMWEAEAKYGLAYFQNFVNSDLDENMIRSMCITGDSLVDIKIKSTGEFLRQIPIQKALEEYNIEDIQIRTSRKYKDIAEKFIYDVKEDLIKVTLEDGKSLTMTKEHPFLVYNNKNELKIVKAEFLQEGMKASCSGMSEEAKLKSSQTKQAGYASGKYKGLKGELNGMYGKHLSEERKRKMSLKLKGHNVTENCRKKSSERWSGINNPVSRQDYWDRKDFKYNNKQISPYEKLIKDELESIGVNFKYQKVFKSEENNRSYVADFYLPEKNLVLELESKCDEKVYLNECPLDFLKEKFDYYKSLGLNVLIFNAAKCNTYRTYINKTVKIVKVEKIYTEGKVYDVRIKQSKKTDFITEDFFANGILTHNCCRLQLDLHELLKRGNGLFGSAEQTGSIGVVTINCARLGYLSKTKEELYERLDILLELGKKTLEAKRKFLTTRLKNGFYPFAKRYLGTWRNHFNTIGVNGVNEMLLNFNGETTATKEGIAFAEEFLDHIRDRLKEFQQETGNMYNLEATPGEGTCYRFAKEDKKRYPDIIQAGQGENIYYNNSSQLPVGYTDDIFEALELQENLQRKYTGGSVLHLFLGERCPNGEVAKNIIRKSFENFKLPYLTLTPTFSICPKHGYIAGEHQFCPICDEQIIQSEKEKCAICGE